MSRHRWRKPQPLTETQTRLIVADETAKTLQPFLEYLNSQLGVIGIRREEMHRNLLRAITRTPVAETSKASPAVVTTARDGRAPGVSSFTPGADARPFESSPAADSPWAQENCGGRDRESSSSGLAAAPPVAVAAGVRPTVDGAMVPPSGWESAPAPMPPQFSARGLDGGVS